MPIRATARSRALPRRSRSDLATLHSLSDPRPPRRFVRPHPIAAPSGQAQVWATSVPGTQFESACPPHDRRESQMAERGDETLVHTLKKVAAVLKQSEIPFALGGSFAVYAHGGHSSDHDVDFLIRGQDVDRAMEALVEAGFTAERPPEDWLVKVYDDGRMVDLIHRPIETPVTEETFADTIVRPVDAIHMPVLSASQLMVHKLLSFSQHYCDFARALPLARSLREQIDWERVRKETQHSPYAEAFLVLLDRLDVVPHSGATEEKEIV
ncbi:nucleotidyltransferase family protein [Micromonospora sp. NPDC002296]|uniref:nucleotidyltransferase family protein n=1 Tax=Micromonospora sp. NPDC002296 TaxID=3154271 RepID=UPI00331E6717